MGLYFLTFSKVIECTLSTFAFVFRPTILPVFLLAPVFFPFFSVSGRSSPAFSSVLFLCHRRTPHPHIQSTHTRAHAPTHTEDRSVLQGFMRTTDEHGSVDSGPWQCETAPCADQVGSRVKTRMRVFNVDVGRVPCERQVDMGLFLQRDSDRNKHS